jgi:hypothetical protein
MIMRRAGVDRDDAVILACLMVLVFILGFATGVLYVINSQYETEKKLEKPEVGKEAPKTPNPWKVADEFQREFHIYARNLSVKYNMENVTITGEQPVFSEFYVDRAEEIARRNGYLVVVIVLPEDSKYLNVTYYFFPRG